jgi:hypothetical protein
VVWCIWWSVDWASESYARVSTICYDVCWLSMYSPSGQLSCYDGHALIWLWRTITGQDGGKHTGRQCARQLYGEFSPPTQPQCVDNDRPNTFTNSSRNLLSVAIMPFRHSTICRSQNRINTQHAWSSHVCKQNVHVLSSPCVLPATTIFVVLSFLFLGVIEDLPIGSGRWTRMFRGRSKETLEGTSRKWRC